MPRDRNMLRTRPRQPFLCKQSCVSRRPEPSLGVRCCGASRVLFGGRGEGGPRLKRSLPEADIGPRYQGSSSGCCGAYNRWFTCRAGRRRRHRRGGQRTDRGLDRVETGKLSCRRAGLAQTWAGGQRQHPSGKFHPARLPPMTNLGPPGLHHGGRLIPQGPCLICPASG